MENPSYRFIKEKLETLNEESENLPTMRDIAASYLVRYLQLVNSLVINIPSSAAKTALTPTYSAALQTIAGLKTSNEPYQVFEATLKEIIKTFSALGKDGTHKEYVTKMGEALTKYEEGLKLLEKKGVADINKAPEAKEVDRVTNTQYIWGIVADNVKALIAELKKFSPATTGK
jgi:hypothetical protein